ncbi:MAG: hypothetical protein ACAI43_03585 [Phycisphaerae bacterium]|nr:hypothetical protein [Tepidisphaeraceae bacterium]
MMRKLSVVGLLTLSVLFAAGCKSEGEKYADDLLAKMKEYADALTSVKDPASSRAAAAKIKSVTDDMAKLAAKAPSIRGTKAEGERLKKRMEAEGVALGQTIEREATRIGANPGLATPELLAAIQSFEAVMGKFATMGGR